MTNLGQMMTGGDRSTREDDDFYATPAECTRALLYAERNTLFCRKETIWEPACGDGAICNVLNEFKYPFIATDIVDRGYVGQEECLDFLATHTPKSKLIITNPPFALADQFIEHAFDIGIEYMALLLKSTFWHAAKRSRLFVKWMPQRMYPLTWRPDFREQGAPTMDCSWMVWNGRAAEHKWRSYKATRYTPLTKEGLVK